MKLMNSLCAAILLGAIACFTACSDDDPAPPVPTGATSEQITATTGGSVAGLGGLLDGAEVTIPANALAADTEITIDVGTDETVTDEQTVGTVVEFGPAGTAFSTPVEVTLKYNEAQIPAGVDESTIKIYRKSGDPAVVEEMTVTARDTDANTVTCETDHFSSFWPTAFTPPSGNDIELAAYLPLNNGDTYQYTADVTGGVLTSDTEPNLEGTALTLWNFNGESMYVTRNAQGQTTRWGFSAEGTIDDQGVAQSPDTFFPAALRVGESFSISYTDDLYAPFGSTTASGTISEDLEMTLESQGSLNTPMGEFNDVILLSFEGTETEGSVSEPVDFDLWLARGVGLIRYVEGTETVEITSATVDGSIVVADVPVTLATAGVFPLVDGNAIYLDDGESITTSFGSVPNVTGDVFTLTYSDEGSDDDDADYLTRETDGSTTLHGFGIFDDQGMLNEQQIFQTAFTLFPTSMTVNVPHETGEQTADVLDSSGTNVGTGTIEFTFTFRGITSFTTSMGEFANVAEVEARIVEDFDGTPVTEEFTLYLAMDIGEVGGQEDGGTWGISWGVANGAPVQADTPVSITTEDYYPINDGDSWEFDVSETDTMTLRDDVPNFAGDRFTYGGDLEFEVVERGTSGETLVVVEQEQADQAADRLQVQFSESFVLLQGTVSPGDVFTQGPLTLTEINADNGNSVEATLTANVTVTYWGIVRRQTALGVFTNCLRVTYESVVSDGTNTETESETIWYALNVGEVATQDESGTRTLSAATVDGEQVAAD